jgi:hypothetical protein
MTAAELNRREIALRERLAEIVDWVYVGPHDPRYRTQRVSEAVETIWCALEGFRSAIREECLYERMMAL